MDLFTNSDKKIIVDVLLFLYKVSSVFLVIFQLFLFLAISFLMDSVVSIYITGLICLAFSLIAFFSKYKYDKLEQLKKELSFITQHSLKNPSKKLIQVVFYDAYINILMSSVLPYVLSVMLVVFITSSSPLYLVIGIAFAGVNAVICMLLIQLKASNLQKNINLFLTIVLSLLLLPLFHLKKFIEFENLDFSKITSNYLNYSELFPLISIIVMFIPLMLLFGLLYYQYILVTQTKFIRNIFVPADYDIQQIEVRKTNLLYRPLEILVLRAFHTKNKITVLKVWSVFLSLLVLLAYPILSRYEEAVPAVHILIFCYTPALMLAVNSVLLYDELLIRRNIYTNYYLIKKFNRKNEFVKQTVFVALLRLSIFLILPQILFLIIYQPVNILYGIVCYSIICIILLHLFVMRMYGMGKYTIEQILILESTTLTSRAAEDMLLIGLPIISAIPIIVINAINGINILFYMFIYIFILCFYYLIKYVVFYLKKGDVHVKYPKPK
ncbi:hypothetical protein CAI16_15675 [Virgibacillus dokdonensis]|uniref:Uncharacterized protein n=1 Tax=Virgibacillus dokdonensis TaxID=302167 RepID=A0A3E0WMG3_9BACI|nr:hypothetical protein CAI16_15675 [Virgibacillus dokdonensis]